MLEKRIKHQRTIIKQKSNDLIRHQIKLSTDQQEPTVPQEEADDEMVQGAFTTVIAQKKCLNRKPFDPNKAKKRRTEPTRDEENYIPYVSKDHQTETG